jgi:hypothetical protein
MESMNIEWGILFGHSIPLDANGVIFLLDHKKMTFDSEMIRIQTPFLRSSNFQMKNVTNVKTVYPFQIYW